MRRRSSSRGRSAGGQRRTCRPFRAFASRRVDRASPRDSSPIDASGSRTGGVAQAEPRRDTRRHTSTPSSLRDRPMSRKTRPMKRPVRGASKWRPGRSRYRHGCGRPQRLLAGSRNGRGSGVHGAQARPPLALVCRLRSGSRARDWAAAPESAPAARSDRSEPESGGGGHRRCPPAAEVYAVEAGADGSFCQRPNSFP
jgi:hypothetical protein